MTGKQITAQFKEAAQTGNAQLALETAEILDAQNLWVSSRAWIPAVPVGDERRIITRREGMCQLCQTWFDSGATVMYNNSGACYCEACWDNALVKHAGA